MIIERRTQDAESWINFNFHCVLRPTYCGLRPAIYVLHFM